MQKNKELENLINAVEVSEYDDKPYEHLYMKSIFSDEFYDEIIQGLPGDDAYTPVPHPQAISKSKNEEDLIVGTPRGKTETIKSTRGECFLDREFVDRYGGPWEKVANILYSKEFKDALFKKFRKTIQQRTERDAWTKDKSHYQYWRPDSFGAVPTALLVRDKKMYTIYPHPDRPTRIVTFQIYLPKDNSHEHLGTSINVPKGESPSIEKQSYAGRDVDNRTLFDEYKKFKFHRNTGYSFAVCGHSWHSVEVLQKESYDRDSIQMMYYVRDTGIWAWKNKPREWGSNDVWIP